MRTQTSRTWLVVVVLALLVGAIGALAQGPGGPQGGMPGGRQGQRGMMPPRQQVTVVAADGAVYVATGDKLMAFEAKTLKKLGEVRIDDGPGGGPGGAPRPPEE